MYSCVVSIEKVNRNNNFARVSIHDNIGLGTM